MTKTQKPVPFAALGKRLKAARLAAHLTQEQAAVAAGFSLGALQSWERGKYRIGLDDAKTLARIYGLSIDDLEAGRLQNMDLRRVPPFFLLVHPGAAVSEERREEAEAALGEVGRRHRKEAEKRSDPRRPGALRPV